MFYKRVCLLCIMASPRVSIKLNCSLFWIWRQIWSRFGGLWFNYTHREVCHVSNTFVADDLCAHGNHNLSLDWKYPEAFRRVRASPQWVILTKDSCWPVENFRSRSEWSKVFLYVPRWRRRRVPCARRRPPSRGSWTGSRRSGCTPRGSRASTATSSPPTAGSAPRGRRSCRARPERRSGSLLLTVDTTGSKGSNGFTNG